MARSSDTGGAMQDDDECELTILMPCLDEAETIQVCIEKAPTYLCTNGSRANDGPSSPSRAVGRRSTRRTTVRVERPPW